MPGRLFRTFTAFMQEEFWLFLLASIGAAFVFPAFGRAHLKPLALPSILAQMYVVMLNIEPARLLAAVRAWRPLARALLFIFVLTPVLALGAHLFDRPQFVLGTAVMAAMPAGMSAPFFALQFGGEAALAVVVTTVSHLLVPLVAPLVVKLVAGSVLTIDPGLIFARLAELVILPFALAWLTRRLLGAARTAVLYRAVGWTSGFFVLIVTWGIVADITVVTVPFAALAAFIALVNGALFAAGYFLGGAERRTQTMSAGYRNVTLGMVLAMSVWGDPLIALPSVVWTLTHNLFATGMLFLHRRRRAA
jgi:BASS family bile acid:Na+ symporter